jgi:hypothetical protein
MRQAAITSRAPSSDASIVSAAFRYLEELGDQRAGASDGRHFTTEESPDVTAKMHPSPTGRGLGLGGYGLPIVRKKKPLTGSLGDADPTSPSRRGES